MAADWATRVCIRCRDLIKVFKYHASSHWVTKGGVPKVESVRLRVVMGDRMVVDTKCLARNHRSRTSCLQVSIGVGQTSFGELTLDMVPVCQTPTPRYSYGACTANLSVFIAPLADAGGYRRAGKGTQQSDVESRAMNHVEDCRHRIRVPRTAGFVETSNTYRMFAWHVRAREGHRVGKTWSIALVQLLL